jgi:hypothetical protein
MVVFMNQIDTSIVKIVEKQEGMSKDNLRGRSVIIFGSNH